MEKYYCRNCGHEVSVNEEGKYICDNCKCEGNNAIDVDEIISELESRKEDYELGGVEITDEDAIAVIDNMVKGNSLEVSLDDVLQGIADCLEYDDDDDDDDYDDDYEDIREYCGSYDKRNLKKEGLCIVTWPESQYLLDMDDFTEHCWLINDSYGLNRFGSCAYVVEEDWYIND